MKQYICKKCFDPCIVYVQKEAKDPLFCLYTEDQPQWKKIKNIEPTNQKERKNE